MALYLLYILIRPLWPPILPMQVIKKYMHMIIYEYIIIYMHDLKWNPDESSFKQIVFDNFYPIRSLSEFYRVMFSMWKLNFPFLIHPLQLKLINVLALLCSHPLKIQTHFKTHIFHWLGSSLKSSFSRVIKHVWRSEWPC